MTFNRIHFRISITGLILSALLTLAMIFTLITASPNQGMPPVLDLSPEAQTVCLSFLGIGIFFFMSFAIKLACFTFQTKTPPESLNDVENSV